MTVKMKASRDFPYGKPGEGRSMIAKGQEYEAFSAKDADFHERSGRGKRVGTEKASASTRGGRVAKPKANRKKAADTKGSEAAVSTGAETATEAAPAPADSQEG